MLVLKPKDESPDPAQTLRTHAHLLAGASCFSWLAPYSGTSGVISGGILHGKIISGWVRGAPHWLCRDARILPQPVARM
jgi:hypothetical protein